MNSKMLQSEQSKITQATLDYWELFRNLPEAYIMFEAAEPYRIVEVNKAREKLTGISRQNSIGRPLFTVFPDMSDRFRKTGLNEVRQNIQEVIRTGKTKQFDPLRYDTKDDRGVTRVRYWRSMYMPIFDETKHMRFVLSVSQDVTDEVRAAHRVASVEDRLQAALAIGKVGSWLWDVTRNVVTSDKNLARLFRLSKQRLAEGLTIEDLLMAIHPDDRSHIQEAIQRSIDLRVPFDEEYRITLSDGTQRWVLARGKVEEQDGNLLFPGVIVDITERHDLQAQVELARRQDQLNRRAAKILQKRNEELEAIGHSKDEFVALASHQLRTPATAVKQYLGMVLQGYVGEVTPVQTDMLEKAFESNERQIQIINQILNAARADTGRLIMAPIPLDLRTLVRGAWSDMRSSFDQRHQRARAIMPQQPILVAADQTYLRMAVENLLHNACMYTPDGGNITMRLSREGDVCRLSITDTGVGIRKADFNKLFAKFSRIHNPLSVQAGGSGIGLYLASEIIRLHSGKISVESKIHKGSTFAILLPLMHN